MDQRQAYERDVLSHFAGLSRRPNLSDEERARERRLAHGLKAAIAGMDAAIAQVNADSLAVKIRDGALDDFVNDELPSDAVWEEKLSAIARGYA